MKRLKLFLILLAVCSVFGANAYDFSKDGIYYNITGANTVEVTRNFLGSYTGYVTIPTTVTYGGKTYTVTAIGNDAFAFDIDSSKDGDSGYDPNDLKSVYIPNSVKRIGNSAFWGCYGLKNLVIPNSVNIIGEWAFAYSGLKSIKIGNMVSQIGDHAFANVELTSVTCMATTPPTIFENTFDSDCHAVLIVPTGCLDSYRNANYWKEFYRKDEASHFYDFYMDGIYYTITGTNTVEVAFETDAPLSTSTVNFSRPTYIGHVSIPSSVTFGGQTYTVTGIGYKAFNYCRDMTDITIPNTVTLIDIGAFDECSGLTSVTIPNSVTTINGAAFWDCTSMTSISIPNSVTEIGGTAFYDCSSLTSVTIPNQVTTISAMLFIGCSALTSVTIPNSVTSIERSAFSGCSALPNVIIPNSVTTIGESAFNGCSALTSVTIGSSVTSIQDKAFYNCPVLRDVKCKASTPPTMAAQTVFDDALYTDQTNMSALTVPMGSRSAYESANWWKDFMVIMEETYDFVVNGFYYRITGDNTVELTTKSEMGKTYSGNVTVPSSVTYGGKTYTVTGIGNMCFAWCSLTGLTLPSTITYIGESAFSMCSGFGNLTLPSSLTEIDAYAFALCSGLTSLVIPNSVTNIGKYAFNYCRNLTSLTLPSDLINLGKGAFNECSGLTTMTLPNTVTVIQGETFKGCSALTSVTLGDRVTNIYYQAFDGCSALTSVTIPATVTLIGSNAFNGCASLTSVNSLAVTPPTIYSSTFTSNHYSTVMLTVPYGSTSAYQAADYWKNFTTISEFREAYACYTPLNTTLTFYYDGQRASRLGTTYDLNTGANYPGWISDGTYPSVTQAVFDPSFADARPTSTSKWFNAMNSLQSITGLEYLNTTQVTNMSSMFYYCNSLTSLDLSSFNTSSVTTLAGMFNGCSGLTSLDVSNFDTSRVTALNSMFFGCSGLTRLDLSSFKTSKVTGMQAMFYGCSELTTVYVGKGWTTAAVTLFANMFMGCTKIRGEKGTTYDANHIDKAYAHIDGGPSNPGYFSEKPAGMPGDVNGNGSVNMDDLTALINYLLTDDATGINMANAANCDGNDGIGMDDLTALINYLLTDQW